MWFACIHLCGMENVEGRVNGEVVWWSLLFFYLLSFSSSFSTVSTILEFLGFAPYYFKFNYVIMVGAQISTEKNDKLAFTKQQKQKDHIIVEKTIFPIPLINLI